MEINDYYSKVNSLRDVYGNPISLDRWDKDHPNSRSKEPIIELIKQVNNTKTVSKKKEVFVSIMPTWHCTNNCYYCKFGDLRKYKAIAKLEDLHKRLDEIKGSYSIDKIVLTGGEISTLDQQYLIDLINLCKQYTQQVECETSLADLKLYAICQVNNIPLWISLNKERPNNYLIEQFVAHIGQCNVQMVLLPSLIDYFEYSLFEYLIDLNVKTVRFLQYSPSVENSCHQLLTNTMYQKQMCTIINYWLDYKYDSINIANITDPIDFAKHDDLYIDPWARLCTIDYERGLEYFKLHKSLDDYKHWVTQLNDKYVTCKQCQHYKKECSGTLRPQWTYNEDTCNGLPELIKCIQHARQVISEEANND